MSTRCQSWVAAWLCLTAPLALSGAPPGGAAAPQAGLSMDQAVRRVEQQYHARVVKAESQQANGHTVYTLRLLNDSGKVWTVHVDAASGALL